MESIRTIYYFTIFIHFYLYHSQNRMATDEAGGKKGARCAAILPGRIDCIAFRNGYFADNHQDGITGTGSFDAPHPSSGAHFFKYLIDLLVSIQI
ncbi:hypothetical protein ET418_09015 [Oryzomonas rubra]|uniref:Uncharacterized protein n=1 Tax=Oryzomonas rubra TaxID=2509454 RepID=A0A5A9XEF5_9BACT|nr:hypothetical protein ET418_09015 [Oryzomonas rubra]